MIDLFATSTAALFCTGKGTFCFTGGAATGTGLVSFATVCFGAGLSTFATTVSLGFVTGVDFTTMGTGFFITATGGGGAGSFSIFAIGISFGLIKGFGLATATSGLIVFLGISIFAMPYRITLSNFNATSSFSLGGCVKDNLSAR